ncbi:MAG: hypothetical protein K6T83_19515 [Alicyclobacillus sp.]|nr:hypothetical protein [Alicyclobacillus sp.]
MKRMELSCLVALGLYMGLSGSLSTLAATAQAGGSGSTLASTKPETPYDTSVVTQPTNRWADRVNGFLNSLSASDIMHAAQNFALENRFIHSSWAKGTTRNEVVKHVQLSVLKGKGAPPVVVATTTNKADFGQGEDQFLYTYTGQGITRQSTIAVFGHTISPSAEAAVGVLDGHPSMLATGFGYPRPTYDHEVRIATWHGTGWHFASSILFRATVDVDKILSIQRFKLSSAPDDIWQFNKASGPFWYLPVPQKASIPNFSFGPADFVKPGHSVIVWGWLPPFAGHSFIINFDHPMDSSGQTYWLIHQNPDGTFRAIEKIPKTAADGTYQLSVLLGNAGDTKDVVEGWLNIHR